MILWAAVAWAECGAEAPLLTLGDVFWSVDGGEWATDTARVVFEDGFAFEVRWEGRVVGVVFSGHARQQTVDPGGLLRAALLRELDLTVPAGAWDTPVDLVWGAGVTALPEWTPLRQDGSGSIEVADQTMETVMVLARRDLAAARERARAAVADRARALSDVGYPLVSMLGLHDAGWRLLEARTPHRVGALAGTWSGSADPWLTTLVDDPLLDGGRRVATVSFGTRYVEGLSGG